MDFFMMALCPGCKKVITNIHKLINCDFSCDDNGDKLKGRLDFRMHLVGGLDGQHLRSMHGPNEVDGDKVYACARKMYPLNYDFVKLMACMEKEQHEIPANSWDCAPKHGMSYTKIWDCVNGLRAEKMVRQSFKYSIHERIHATPVMYLEMDGRREHFKNPTNFSAVKKRMCEMLWWR